MEALGWLVAYVVGFGLVQLLLYRYIQRDDASPDAAPGRVDQSAGRSMEQSSARPDESTAGEDEAGVHCRHCGAFNEYDQMFTYCKQCAGPLQ